MASGGTIECHDCHNQRPARDRCSTCGGQGVLTPEQYADHLNAERHRLLDEWEAGDLDDEQYEFEKAEIDQLWREEFGETP